MSDIRICFVGDSFLNGTSDESALGWVGRLCRSAYSQGVPVTGYNLGVRRDTSRDVSRRLALECKPRLPAGCDARIVLSCGVNDTTWESGATRVPFDESVSNLEDMLAFASQYRCLVVGPPPVNDEGHSRRISSLSDAFKEVCAKRTVPFVGLFTPLVADETYRRAVRQGDGAHPNSRGYERMAELIAASPQWWFRDGR